MLAVWCLHPRPWELSYTRAAGLHYGLAAWETALAVGHPSSPTVTVSESVPVEVTSFESPPTFPFQIQAIQGVLI